MINREFIIVFQLNNPDEFHGKRRFAVGANSLDRYVGKKNAKTAVSRALNSKDDKCTVRLRKHGRIDFYSK